MFQFSKSWKSSLKLGCSSQRSKIWGSFGEKGLKIFLSCELLTIFGHCLLQGPDYKSAHQAKLSLKFTGNPASSIYINKRSASRGQISYLRIRTVEIIEEDAAHTAGDVPVLYAEIVIAPRLEFAVVSAKN